MQLPDRIQKDTEEWRTFLRFLSWSKQKSNRDVFCLKCWKILKYEECVRHKSSLPDHVKSILTSKEFSSETKFVSIARAMNRVAIEGERELYENPYKSKDKRGRPSTQLLLYREELKKKEEEDKRQSPEDRSGMESQCYGVDEPPLVAAAASSLGEISPVELQMPLYKHLTAQVQNLQNQVEQL
jgi:hypothetical protein